MPKMKIAVGFGVFVTLFFAIWTIMPILKYEYWISAAKEVKIIARDTNINEFLIDGNYSKLKVKEQSLPEGFRSGSGAVNIINGKLIVTDRVGQFAVQTDQDDFKILKDLRILNDIEKFDKLYGGNSRNAMRVHDVEIDCKRGKLVAFYTKLESRWSGRLLLDAFNFDCEKIDKKLELHQRIYTKNLTIEQVLNSQAAGGGLYVSPDNNNIYFSIGYAETDEEIENQVSLDRKTDSGKTLFASYNKDELYSKPKIYSIGHRNVTGITVHQGEVYTIEHGPKGGDELNLISEGKNYGWPVSSYGTYYGSFDIVNDESNKTADISSPVFAFIPSIAPSDITTSIAYPTKFKRELLVVSTLKTKSLYFLYLTGNKIEAFEKIFIGKRLRAVTSVENKVYVLADDGYLLTIEQSKDNNASNGFIQKNAAAKNCFMCHNMTDPTIENADALSLMGITKRNFSENTLYPYSKTLKDVAGIPINLENFKSFIKQQSPYEMTNMPKINLTDREIEELYELLSKY